MLITVVFCVKWTALSLVVKNKVNAFPEDLMSTSPVKLMHKKVTSFGAKVSCRSKGT